MAIMVKTDPALGFATYLARDADLAGIFVLAFSLFHSLAQTHHGSTASAAAAAAAAAASSPPHDHDHEIAPHEPVPRTHDLFRSSPSPPAACPNTAPALTIYCHPNEAALSDYAIGVVEELTRRLEAPITIVRLPGRTARLWVDVERSRAIPLKPANPPPPPALGLTPDADRRMWGAWDSVIGVVDEPTRSDLAEFSSFVRMSARNRSPVEPVDRKELFEIDDRNSGLIILIAHMLDHPAPFPPPSGDPTVQQDHPVRRATCFLPCDTVITCQTTLDEMISDLVNLTSSASPDCRIAYPFQPLNPGVPTTDAPTREPNFPVVVYHPCPSSSSGPPPEQRGSALDKARTLFESFTAEDITDRRTRLESLQRLTISDLVEPLSQTVSDKLSLLFSVMQDLRFKPVFLTKSQANQLRILRQQQQQSPNPIRRRAETFRRPWEPPADFFLPGFYPSEYKFEPADFEWTVESSAASPATVLWWATIMSTHERFLYIHGDNAMRTAWLEIMAFKSVVEQDAAESVKKMRDAVMDEAEDDQRGRSGWDSSHASEDLDEDAQDNSTLPPSRWKNKPVMEAGHGPQVRRAG